MIGAARIDDIGRLGRGGASVGFDLLCKFADALGVPVCDLIDF